MNRRQLFRLAAALASLAALPAFAAPPGPEVQVFKSPSCGCCGSWVEHMRAAGFTVKVTEVNDATAAHKRLGTPDRYGSCHTATVGGHVLEGHVPDRKGPYEVLLVDASGQSSVFARDPR